MTLFDKNRRPFLGMVNRLAFLLVLRPVLALAAFFGILILPVWLGALCVVLWLSVVVFYSLNLRVCLISVFDVLQKLVDTSSDV